MGCINAKLMVVDAASGQVLTELAIGCGNDAIVFDPKRKRVFSSNGGDGTVTSTSKAQAIFMTCSSPFLRL